MARLHNSPLEANTAVVILICSHFYSKPLCKPVICFGTAFRLAVIEKQYLLANQNWEFNIVLYTEIKRLLIYFPLQDICHHFYTCSIQDCRSELDWYVNQKQLSATRCPTVFHPCERLSTCTWNSLPEGTLIILLMLN